MSESRFGGLTYMLLAKLEGNVERRLYTESIVNARRGPIGQAWFVLYNNLRKWRLTRLSGRIYRLRSQSQAAGSVLISEWCYIADMPRGRNRWGCEWPVCTI